MLNLGLVGMAWLLAYSFLIIGCRWRFISRGCILLAHDLEFFDVMNLGWQLCRSEIDVICWFAVTLWNFALNVTMYICISLEKLGDLKLLLLKVLGVSIFWMVGWYIGFLIRILLYFSSLVKIDMLRVVDQLILMSLMHLKRFTLNLLRICWFIRDEIVCSLAGLYRFIKSLCVILGQRLGGRSTKTAFWRQAALMRCLAHKILTRFYWNWQICHRSSYSLHNRRWSRHDHGCSTIVDRACSIWILNHRCTVRCYRTSDWIGATIVCLLMLA